MGKSVSWKYAIVPSSCTLPISGARPRSCFSTPARMDFGGASHGQHLAPASSSSSTLSPLAPPFTVGRGGSRAALPYDPYASSWSQEHACTAGSLDFCPPSPVAPSKPMAAQDAAAAVDGGSYFGRGQSTAGPSFGRLPSGDSSAQQSVNLAQVEPYYPRFFSSAAASGGGMQSLDHDYRDGSPSDSVNLGRRVALPNAPFDMGIEANGTAGSSVWAEEYGHLQGDWRGKDYDYSSGKNLFNQDNLDLLKAEKKAESGKAFSSMRTDPVSFHKAASFFPSNTFSANSNNPGGSADRCFQHVSYKENLTRPGDFASVKISLLPVINCAAAVDSDTTVTSENLSALESCHHENILSDIPDEHHAIDSPCWKGVSPDASSGRMFDFCLQTASDNSSFPREVGNNTSCSKCPGDFYISLDKNLKEEIFGATATEVANEIANKSNLDKHMPSSSSKADSDEVDAQLLVKTIHNLSGVLLRACRSDANALKDNEREILRLAINNLDLCNPRNIESDGYSSDVRLTLPKQLETPPTRWHELEDSAHQPKHNLDALRLDLATSGGPGEPPQLKGLSKVNPLTPSGIDHFAVDVDPLVMGRFRVLKGRKERFNLFDSGEPRASDFPYGSSDWEHVLKEELT